MKEKFPKSRKIEYLYFFKNEEWMWDRIESVRLRDNLITANFNPEEMVYESDHFRIRCKKVSSIHPGLRGLKADGVIVEPEISITMKMIHEILIPIVAISHHGFVRVEGLGTF